VRYKFYRPEFSDGRYDPDEAPKRVMLESCHKAVPDFVTVHARPALCPEARALIEALEPGVHQFLPVEVVRPGRSKRPIHRLDGRALDEPYYLFIPQTVLDAVWIERSEVRVDPTHLGPPVVVPRYVGRYDNIVLRRELTEGRHVWRGRFHLPGRIIFSDALARAVDERKLRGLEWIHLGEA
jgi:uncharacterized protein DUF1629